jgi:5-methylthioadenosine/S-adenosylhomocysteine deaminase
MTARSSRGRTSPACSASSDVLSVTTSATLTEAGVQQPLLLRCRRLIRRADLQPQDDVGVLVDAGRVVTVQPWAALELQHPAVARRTLDGVVIPGLVDAHSHLRGLALSEQGVGDELLEGWLLRLRSLTSLPAGDEALVALTDLARTGVTSVQGVLHVFDEPAEYGALVEDVVRAVHEVGVRADVMVGLTDQAEWVPPQDVPDALGEYVGVRHGTDPEAFDTLVHTVAGRWDSPLVRIGAAPVAPQWCSDDLLATAQGLAHNGFRLHTHLLESPWQRGWLAEDPVSRLARWELLGPFLSVAHGVWLETAELLALEAAGVTPVHCPTSNAALQVGAARVRDWIDAGLSPALGLDSHDQAGRVDAFAEMRAAQATAAILGAPLTAQEVLAMATTGGASALGRDRQLGCIEPGSSADLVLLDLPVAEFPLDDTVRVLVDTGSPELVQEVYCAGSRIVEHGSPRTKAAADQSREHLRQLVAEEATARLARQRRVAPVTDKLLSHLRQRAVGHPGSVTR